ncbi:MAG: sigma-70 family RNA polymerase sigma factor [Pseudomonadota bacterium]
MSDSGDLSDAELCSEVAAGDERAMRVLYERHHRSVEAFARNRLRDSALVADIVHDVMIDVWRKPEAFAGRSSFRTWLFTLTRNKVVDALRKTGRIDYGDEGMDLVDDRPLADDIVQAAQDRERMRACIEGLSGAHRSAIQLTFFEGLTVTEAAEVEDVPPGTIKTRIFHAKKLLAACLGAR